MFKLYGLGIIFYVCAVVLSEPHAKELVQRANIKKKPMKSKIKSWVNTIVMGLMPIVNVIMGVALLIIMSGQFDDILIEELKKNSLK